MKIENKPIKHTDHILGISKYTALENLTDAQYNKCEVLATCDDYVIIQGHVFKYCGEYNDMKQNKNMMI